MPDIALCKNYICPLSERCHRFLAKPSDFVQAYDEFEPNDEGECDYFIEHREGVWYNEDDQ